MTKEQEAINNIKVFIRSIKSDLAEESEDNQKLANDIETVLSMIKEKDRQIDLMAEEINETNRGYNDYCKFKIVCDRNCKSCIKQYFERKSEE